jgi:hypothetical protein
MKLLRTDFQERLNRDSQSEMSMPTDRTTWSITHLIIPVTALIVKVVNLSTGVHYCTKKGIRFCNGERSGSCKRMTAIAQLEILISVFNGNIGGTPAKGSYVYHA